MENLLLIAPEVEMNKNEKANSNDGCNSEKADSIYDETVLGDIFARE